MISEKRRREIEDVDLSFLDPEPKVELHRRANLFTSRKLWILIFTIGFAPFNHYLAIVCACYLVGCSIADHATIPTNNTGPK